MATVVIVLDTEGAQDWPVPADWNSANNSIKGIGGGACATPHSSAGSTAGPGAAFAKAINVPLTGGDVISVYVAPKVTTSSPRQHTWFGSDNPLDAACKMYAEGAQTGVGLYGRASISKGDVKYDGGDIDASRHSGGGGAAGENGPGKKGGANAESGPGATGGGGGGGVDGGTDGAAAVGATGGIGGKDFDGNDVGGDGGGTGAPGANGDDGTVDPVTGEIVPGAGGGSGANAQGGDGGKFGGGGGSTGSRGHTNYGRGGYGSQGVIVITYEAAEPPPPAPAPRRRSSVRGSMVPDL